MLLAPSRSVALPSVSFSVHFGDARAVPALLASSAVWVPLPAALSVGVGWSVALPSVVCAWRQQGLGGALPSVSVMTRHASVLTARFTSSCALSDWVWLPSGALSVDKIVTFFMRGIDDSGQFVYWSSIRAPLLSPTSTHPVQIGTVSNVCVIAAVTG